MGIFFTIAGGLVSFLSGVGVSLSKIGAVADQVASQEAVNGIVFAALFLAIIFILVGCLGNLARALFSMTAHTIRSREPQFFNVRQSEANMLFSFFELDAFGRVLSVKDEGQ
ncbi:MULTISPECIES: hypothetical protein [unclassified Ruegeria]|uniref:hypothetical protein n=1 Tax=unclassified Ruegeria TaxID=2625375 RepID=UPI0014925FD9|nr:MULTISPECIES: hypothetical protein [unclassified Ruegeria]NOD49326.1 hypothetical protein [Ruegeria sp. HKCCD5849]NOD53375.1 hypothetical protein [Ruegeria sp. HKCCD5851]NOD69699.1 hypothetical protein [Ruegeria sp. HKCCD7303]